MAITTTVKQFLRSVGETLQDISPQYSRWPEIELVVYANYAQRAIAKYLPQAGSRVDAIKLLPGTKQDLTRVLAANILPGDGSTPADVHGIALLDLVRNMGANGATPGRVVRLIDRYTKDTNDPLWHTKTGAEIREYVHDKQTPRIFYAVPGVPSAGPDVWIEVSWMAEPRAIAAGGEPGSEVYAYAGPSTALMGIHDQFIEDAHNYVVAMASLKRSKNTENMQRASVHTTLFTSSINTQATVLTGVNPNMKALPFADQIASPAA